MKTWIRKWLGIDQNEARTNARLEDLENGTFLADHTIRLNPGEVYVIVVPEQTPAEVADNIRRALESRGIIAIVVASDSISIVNMAT